MPRKAPKEVYEHRITLGDYERKMIAKQLSEDDLIKKIETGRKIGTSVLMGGAVIGLGSLAVIAYREVHDAVDKAQDIKGTAWTMFKWRLGLESWENVVAEAQEFVENEDEREQASQDRKNMGVLEWGFEWMLKFLLGEDMIWTKATDSNTTTDNTNISPYQKEKQNSPYFEDILKQNDTGYQEFWILMHGNLNGYTVEGAYNLFHGLAP